jgi:ankyrin repeat protein
MHKQSPMHLASMNGLSAVVRILIDKGVEVNVRDNDGDTPLHHACIYDQFELVQYYIGND